MTDLPFLPALEQADLVRTKQISPTELVNEYLERIEKFDQTLNSYVTLLGEQALDQAAEAERRLGSDDLPPFHGVPISIKDLNEVAGVRTTSSTKTHADRVAQEDDSTVRRIKESGFIIMGKTNTPEFGLFPMTESELNGVCRNPWDTDRTPGGSSGGAAAGVAAGLAPIAQGSDGGGSIRIPSSCCGLFGIKPSRGRVSSAPKMGESLSGLSTNGPIARTVADAAAMLDVIAGYETGDPYWAPEPERPFAQEVGADPGRLRVAFTAENPLGSPVDPDCLAALQSTCELLQSLGHTVEEAKPEWDDPNASSFFVTIWATLTVPYGIPSDQMEPLNRTLTELAESTPSTKFVESKNGIHKLSREIVAFWDEFDLLVTPTLALPPIPVGWIHEEEDPWQQFVRSGLFAAFTPIVNLTGQPAVSVPLYWNEAGLPIGTQIVGRPADEATLFRISAQLEEARPWAERRPPVS
jgi:amidase